MIRTTTTEHENKRYEIQVDTTKHDECFHAYCQIYRLRRDGTRGLQLSSHTDLAWTIWSKVRNEMVDD